MWSKFGILIFFQIRNFLNSELIVEIWEDFQVCEHFLKFESCFKLFFKSKHCWNVGSVCDIFNFFQLHDQFVFRSAFEFRNIFKIHEYFLQCQLFFRIYETSKKSWTVFACNETNEKPYSTHFASNCCRIAQASRRGEQFGLAHHSLFRFRSGTF